jgi:hypothetical protein
MGRVMADVVFVFVREDAREAQALAEAFDAAGFSLADDNLHDRDAVSILLWSRPALRARAFAAAAERALNGGRALIAALSAAPPRENGFGAPVFDLANWDGEDDLPLKPLFQAVENMRAPANVIRLPARPAYEDAEFEEPGLPFENESEERARRAWEAPIPAGMLARTGARAPRRDFARTGQRKSHALARAALAIGLVALIGGGVVTARILSPPEPAFESARVSVAEASTQAFGPELMPTEPPDAASFYSGGREPPSASFPQPLPPASLPPSPSRAAPLIIAEDTSSRALGPQS